MATSGSFTGSRGGGSTGPYLVLDWSRVSTDITNNRSKLRLTLKLVSNYGLYFSADKSGNLEGSSFTYTGNFSGTGTKTLKTRELWVNHDADGSKSITLNATFNIQVSWSGNFVSSLSVSGTANIDTIPRASDFTAFTLSNSTLNKDTSVNVNYTLGRKSGDFSHLMTLRYGNRVVDSWTDGGTGSRVRTITAADINTLIRAMPTYTGGTFVLTMQTRSGSRNIGSAKTRSDTFSLSSAITPTASGLSVSIAGSGRDKTINKYVQTISKATASFSRAAGYGASISSSTITVRRVGGANSQIISGNSGTVAKPFTHNGTYEIIGTVKDSRGRSATVRTTITVHAYSAPRIPTFNAKRGSTTTTVTNAISASWHALGGDNPATIKVTAQASNDTSPTTVYTITGSTTGSVSTTRTYTGQSDATSFEYIITVTDSFNKKASSSATVGTSFVEMTISKAKGVGIGKVHENGSLDVAGEANFAGQILLHKPPDADKTPRFQMYSNDANGHAYVEIFGNDGVRKGYMGIPNKSADYFRIHAEFVGGAFTLGQYSLDLRGQTAMFGGYPAFSFENAYLWGGQIYLQDGQKVTPTKKLSECPHGWLLLWSRYASGTAYNTHWTVSFISKEVTRLPGSGAIVCNINDINSVSMAKYVYVTDSQLSGHASNGSAPENSRVLRYVYAV